MAGAVIEGPQGVLLVANRRGNGSIDWSTPGGVVDPGETVLEALTREVAEETGLVVAGWDGPIYDIDVTAPDLQWHLRVEVYRGLDVSGEVVIDDPDGIVVEAAWVSRTACRARLAASHHWVREPLTAWIEEGFTHAPAFRYHVQGCDPAELRVERLLAEGPDGR